MTQFLLYRGLCLCAFFLNAIPHHWDKWLFAVLWPLYALTHRAEIERVNSHLRHAAIRPTPTARQIYESLFLNALDSLRYLSAPARIADRVYIVNRDLIRNLLNRGIPVVVVSIHTGAFEIIHRALSALSPRVSLIASHHYRHYVLRWLNDLRSNRQTRVFPPHETPRLLRDLIKNKGILAMMIDQSRSGKGNHVRLLGRASFLWLRLPQQASQLGAAVVTARVVRKGYTHVLRFETVYPPGIAPQDLCKEITLEVERWIIENPEQWAWNYPRLWQTSQ